MNCLNGEKYLEEAIESVLRQSYKHWEVIFWDNNSIDNSRAIIMQYKDERIRYFHSLNKTNLGKARQDAFNKIKGEFLCVLDVDDTWRKNKLSEQLHFFENERVGICYSNSEFFSYKNKENLYPKDIVMKDSCSKLITNYHISLETVMLRVKYIRELEKSFDENYSHISDFDLITRLSTRCGIAYCPKVLACWRIHEGSEGYTKPQLFNAEKLLWIKNNKESKYFSKVDRAIYELEKLVHASKRMYIKKQYNNFFKDITFSYSNARNLFYVLFSYIPILTILAMKIKNTMYKAKWF
ncbi:Glycosyl transferase [Prochlorococcus sp. MIT 0601]|nr:Glycosyl transferase [Prochlorococcus sp. MIT 0601]